LERRHQRKREQLCKFLLLLSQKFPNRWKVNHMGPIWPSLVDTAWMLCHFVLLWVYHSNIYAIPCGAHVGGYELLWLALLALGWFVVSFLGSCRLPTGWGHWRNIGWSSHLRCNGELRALRCPQVDSC
jgi:hypothetical protein